VEIEFAMDENSGMKSDGTDLDIQEPPGSEGGGPMSGDAASGIPGLPGEQPLGGVGSLGELADLGALVPGVSGDLDSLAVLDVSIFVTRYAFTHYVHVRPLTSRELYSLYSLNLYNCITCLTCRVAAQTDTTGLPSSHCAHISTESVNSSFTPTTPFSLLPPKMKH